MFHLEILEDAISDVGHWAWWDGEPSKSIQLEFGGVQLWNDPLGEGQPPSDLTALRFESPEFVAFLTFEDEEEPAPSDWRQKLHGDEVGPFQISHGEFTLRSQELAIDLIRQACAVEVVHGPAIEELSSIAPSCILAFRADTVGAIVFGSSMKVLGMGGEMGPDKIAAKYEGWWEYWREYWVRKESNDPLPYDLACEVTIPAEEEEG